jgi:predicted dehydrogenase
MSYTYCRYGRIGNISSLTAVRQSISYYGLQIASAFKGKFSFRRQRMDDSSLSALEVSSAAALPIVATHHEETRHGLRSRHQVFADRSQRSDVLRVGVIGYGYWGPNVVRNFHSQEHSRVVMICDRRPEALQKAARMHPELEVIDDFTSLLRSPDIDVVAIVTPVWTHFELAKAALNNGKHVFVEKPFTLTSAQSEELIELAYRKHLKIMVDHTFLFTGAVRKIKQLVDAKELGDLYYYDTMRVNLGLFQHDVNVIWDLAPHDLAIMDHILSTPAEAVVATGQKHVNSVEDMAFLTIYYPGRVIAHVNVNWLSPVKVRSTLLGGDKKMLIWNDLESDEKIRIYDRGVNLTAREGVYDLLVSYRSGDMWAPHVENVEALSLEIAHFNRCILEDRAPINDGEAGLRVVKILEAANRSLANRGTEVRI